MTAKNIGRYEIKGKLGSGGMATVYLAFDPMFEREVAIKILPRQLIKNEIFRTLFVAEVKIIGKLEHPAIVPVYDAGIEKGQPFFVMRYMTGGSLADRIAREIFTIREAAKIFSRLGLAIDEAHTQNIIHMDLKPGNILFDDRDEPYISDFGIARILSKNKSELSDSGRLSKSFLNTLQSVFKKSNQNINSDLGLQVVQNPSNEEKRIIIGSPLYMSPEQSQGDEPDGRSDIYSLGVILFEMLTGDTPFHANTSQGLMYKHVHEPIPNILEVNPNLHPLIEMVIETAMAKNCDNRFSTASELVSVLASIADVDVDKNSISLSSQNKITVSEKLFEINTSNEQLDFDPSTDIDQYKRYKIIRELGTGGVTTTYLAYDPVFEREVALKVIKKELLQEADVQERFERETKIVTKLEHTAIVPVYDFGYDNGHAFFVMRYMAGGSLTERIQNSAIDIEQISRTIIRLADALDYAHRMGVVHRNVKPNAIFFDETGNAFLSDFIIAKVEMSVVRITHSGIIGTPRYMSPEQARGDETDGRADQYSLAVVLFELLGGHTPFEATTPLAMAFKHATESPPSILSINSKLPQALDAILSKALQKEPGERFKTCAEFVSAVINIIGEPGEGLLLLEDVEDTTSRRLNLSGQNLTEIPEYVFTQKSIESLDLSNNNIVSLPAKIGFLENLTYLNLGNNNLTDLPSSLNQLTKLTGLILNNNNFDSVPDVIVELQNLVFLDMRDNKIKVLPIGLATLNKLSVVELLNNPLTKPPLEVVKQGFKAIREYLRQLSLGQEQLFEAKLLILGEGGAGKTTLAKKILNPSYKLLQNEQSTEGIDVIKWTFPFDNDKVFRVNIWDFGGQEIYHATHQYFLTKRSLYILVADSRKEDTDFYYWLKVVELLSDNSPLLIVKNEKQDRHREINERQLRSQFDNLSLVLETNLANNRNLENVLNEIKHHIGKLPHIGLQLPQTWVRVREILEKDPRNHITQNEFLEVCYKNGFAQKDDSLLLSDYLHDLGVILHFREDPILKNTVILKPKWGTDATYKVLDNQAVIRNLGHFTRADLAIIWNDPNYAGMTDELLQLMMKFHLCYAIPNLDGVYIAPQLLTENQPHYDWDTKDNLIVRYSYEFMPKGILTQFIVIAHHLIMEQKYVWKSGVIIERDNTQAEVVEFYGNREVRIRVSGAHKVELMAIVMYQLDQIHASYQRLKYSRLIPCNCPECKLNEESHFYPFERLQRFVEDGQDSIQCPISYRMVDVRGLIADVLPSKNLGEVNDEKKETAVTKYEFRIEAGARVDGPIVLGSKIDDSFIKESFNNIESADMSDELKMVLQRLAQSVDNMNKQLSDSQSQDVAKDLDMLVREATQENPRAKWYHLSADGLIKAAEKMGKIGMPVIELTSKAISLLTQGK